MNNKSEMPVGRARFIRWAVGITLASALVGGGIAMALGDSSTGAAGQSTDSTAQLNALLSASGSGASGSGASGTGASNAGTSGTAATTAAGARARNVRALRRLRGLGGMYGSFTFRTASGDETLAYERGTIESVSSSDVVVRAADGTTMTWLLVSDTVVRDHGKSSTSALADGQLVFVGGPVTSEARDARLIVVRTGGSNVPAGRAAAVS
jgi:hypothetical protein